jgi:large subunit ribosomal protein L22
MAEKKKGGPKGAPKSKPKGESKAEPKAETRAAAKKPAKKAAVVRPEPTRIKYEPREARALQRMARQSPYKMRLVIDQIRGKTVNEALALLTFSKKHAAKQIEKVLKSAVANAENRARSENASLDVDELFIKYAVVNEGQKMKRWTPAAMGRATPMIKRTSHIEIVVSERPEAH